MTLRKLPPRLARALVLVGLVATPAVAQLPPPPAPPENPLTPEKAVLGKILFWDEQLSSDNTMACGTCHQPAAGGAIPVSGLNPGYDGILGTADDVFGAPGVIASDADNDYLPDPVFGLEPQVGGRYPQANIMAAYAFDTFWDGRGSDRFVDPQSGQVLIPFGGGLESQSVGPPLSAAEMAHADRDWAEISAKLASSRPLALARDLPADVAAALAGDPGYPELFQRAFASPEIDAGRIAFALASYQRTLVPDQSPYDLGTLTALQAFGKTVFDSDGHCIRCHGGETFSDHRYHNIGLHPPEWDLGRQNVTGNRADRGKFKTPSVRNSGLRRRFMHNGEFQTMTEVVEYYDLGGRGHDNQDLEIFPLGLTGLQIAALVDFVENGLTDPRVAAEQHPFDRPTLFSERVDEHPRAYGQDSAGSGGLRPRVIARTPANLGNVDFKIGLADALGGAAALLGLAPQSASFDLGGVPLNIDYSAAVLRKLHLCGGTPGVPGEGHATQRLRIPDIPAWTGLPFFAQWLVSDPAAPAGLAATRGVEYVLR